MDIFAYIVGCERQRVAMLIDPAAEVDRVVAQAEEEGLAIELIVNTHPHGDHVAGNARAKELTGAAIAVHEEAAPLLEGALRPQMALFLGGEASPPADRLLRDGEVIALGEERLEVRHTPGHCPGSVCLVGGGNVFTGDVLFVGAVGRTDLPGGSPRVLRRSIDERLLSLPPDTVVYPGHDYGSEPTSTIGHEARTNFFLR